MRKNHSMKRDQRSDKPNPVRSQLAHVQKVVTKKPATSLVDSAVPKSAAVKNLSEGEKKALELNELAEHADGQERENLQKKAKRQADSGQ